MFYVCSEGEPQEHFILYCVKSECRFSISEAKKRIAELNSNCKNVEQDIRLIANKNMKTFEGVLQTRQDLVLSYKSFTKNIKQPDELIDRKHWIDSNLSILKLLFSDVEKSSLTKRLVSTKKAIKDLESYISNFFTSDEIDIEDFKERVMLWMSQYFESNG